MEDVVDWLERAGLMQGRRAARATAAQLAEELRSGLVLAGLAARLDPGHVGRDSIAGRPSMDIQGGANLFVRGCVTT